MLLVLALHIVSSGVTIGCFPQDSETGSDTMADGKIVIPSPFTLATFSSGLSQLEPLAPNFTSLCMTKHFDI